MPVAVAYHSPPPAEEELRETYAHELGWLEPNLLPPHLADVGDHAILAQGLETEKLLLQARMRRGDDTAGVELDVRRAQSMLLGALMYLEIWQIRAAEREFKQARTLLSRPSVQAWLETQRGAA